MNWKVLALIGVGLYLWSRGTTGGIDYFNAAGNRYRAGVDTESYWFNKADNTWYRGYTDGRVITMNSTRPPWLTYPL